MIVRMLAVVLALLLALAGLSSYWLSRPVFDEELADDIFRTISIAPREEAITLARSLSGTVLLVTAADAEGVAAIDVGAAAGREFSDALHAYRHLGPSGLRALYDAAATVGLSWAELGMAIPARYPHIAAGTNYRAHAEEVGYDGEPFLFPKLSRPTSWDSDVLVGTRLDYEVELCAVTLSEHTRESPAALGYMLCGDYTDRWLLVRDIDLDGDMGRTGFPLAKGGETRLPVGPLLVIPHEDDFYRALELSLYVNGELRQKAGAGQMVWSPGEILSNTLADCRTPYRLGDETIQIADCERLSAGTLLLTGTPEGVLFHIGTLWNPWAYLRPGDVVTSFGTYLGYSRNEVVEASGAH